MSPMKANHPQIVVTTPSEWLTVQQAARQFSIGRSSIYALLSAGRIRSRLLRVRGNVSGKRLISAESLRMLLEESDG